MHIWRLHFMFTMFCLPCHDWLWILTLEVRPFISHSRLGAPIVYRGFPSNRYSVLILLFSKVYFLTCFSTRWTQALVKMPWPFSESIKKRACRYLLHRYLGNFLQEKLSLDQLSLDLYQGTGSLAQVPLDKWVSSIICAVSKYFNLIIHSHQKGLSTV